MCHKGFFTTLFCMNESFLVAYDAKVIQNVIAKNNRNVYFIDCPKWQSI
jgi:hypothetical protein